MSKDKKLISKNTKVENKSFIASMLPVLFGVFVVYLIIGIALPAIPLHVNKDLGFGSFMVGMVAGAQFAATFISRFWSGHFADKQGGKKTIIVGMIVAAISGLFYIASLFFTGNQMFSAIILLIGRGILGGAESFIISGALLWGLSIGGKENAGKVIAWVGTAMYIAFAAGAPLGSLIYNYSGFTGIAVLTTIVPIATIFFLLPRHSIATKPAAQQSIKKVINAVWIPGVGLAFSSLGFGAIMTFIILLFSNKGWEFGWLALTLFAMSFVIVRVVWGHLPDRIGGAKIALIFAIVETLGLFFIGYASSPLFAFIGAILTGLGYSLVYPGLGVEVVKNTPDESSGLAMGAYSAFLDLALGIANPSLGYIADAFGMSKIYIISAIIVMLSALISAYLLKNRKVTFIKNRRY